MPIHRRNREWLELKTVTGWTVKRLAFAVGRSERLVKAALASARAEKQEGVRVEDQLPPAWLSEFRERPSYRDDPAIREWLLSRQQTA